jgi:hypothetical protein
LGKNLEWMGPFARWLTRGAGRICSPSLSEESEHFFSATMVDQKRRYEDRDGRILGVQRKERGKH